MPRKRLRRSAQWLALFAAILIISTAPASAQGNTHVVQSGENMFRIALRYGITVDTLAQANNILNPNQILVGQTLVIPGGASTTPSSPAPAPAEASPVYHTVQRGETLGAIAGQYGTTWQALAELNNIPNPNRILPGQQLRIFSGSESSSAAVAPDPAPAPAEAIPAPPIATPVPDPNMARTHIVQGGEHLSSIARQYSISWNTIAQANGIVDPNRIYPGQTLLIPAQDAPAGTYMQPTTGQPAGPTPTITNGRQIIVDLSDQRIYAFQDGQMVRNVIVSTGLPNTPTVTGDYNVYWKLASQTMQGPGYYLPGVPWVMYFYQGYAIHGTYWHNNFGTPMSHGCVNLPTPEAAWFFNFADVGTSVRVIY